MTTRPACTGLWFEGMYGYGLYLVTGEGESKNLGTYWQPVQLVSKRTHRRTCVLFRIVLTESPNTLRCRAVSRLSEPTCPVLVSPVLPLCDDRSTQLYFQYPLREIHGHCLHFLYSHASTANHSPNLEAHAEHSHATMRTRNTTSPGSSAYRIEYKCWQDHECFGETPDICRRSIQVRQNCLCRFPHIFGRSVGKLQSDYRSWSWCRTSQTLSTNMSQLMQRLGYR